MDVSPDGKGGVHAPLPPLPELTDDEKFLLKLKDCPSCVKGPKFEEVATRKLVGFLWANLLPPCHQSF